MCADSTAACGIELSSAQLQYTNVSAPHFKCRSRLLYAYTVSPTTDEFIWYLAANSATPNMQLTASGLSINGTAVSVNK